MADGSEVQVRRVVTGVDFHESSSAGALWAMRHLAPRAEHELLHVVELPELPGPLRGLAMSQDEVREAATAGARGRLDDLKARAGDATVHSHVRVGKPAQEIVRLAEETRADLIVAGEQGPARGVAALLGSTAERVLIISPVPVLIARKVSDAPPRRILAAIDPSQVAPRVLAWAAAFAREFGAEVTVLNVVDRVLLTSELSGLPTQEGLQKLETEAVEGMGQWLEEQVRDAGLSDGKVRTKVLTGDPAYEIIAEAARIPADLVVVGSKGADIARTPLIGRIVNKVVRSAPTSVLVVQPPPRR